MAIDIFEPLKDLQGNKQKGASWYRNAVSLITDRSSPSELFAGGKLLGRPSAGRMSMFFYDPKFKQRLPYYDTFPLVMPIGGIGGGFLGINFHYLPIPLRMRLLDKVVNFPNDVNYQGLKRISLLKPTIKKYLNGFVKSEFRIIQPDEFVVAALLPVQNFKNAKKSVSASEVWADSRSMV